MTVEAAVAVTAGVLASSVALIGIGLDSVVEFCAAGIVVWQLRGGGEERETRAVKLIGVTFFALAAYLAVEGLRDLIGQSRPEHSVPGLGGWPIATAANRVRRRAGLPAGLRPSPSASQMTGL